MVGEMLVGAGDGELSASGLEGLCRMHLLGSMVLQLGCYLHPSLERDCSAADISSRGSSHRRSFGEALVSIHMRTDGLTR